MGLILTLLLLGPVMAMQSTPPIRRHHKVAVSTIGRSLHAKPHAAHVPSTPKMRRIGRNRSSDITHTPHQPTGFLYNEVHAAEDTGNAQGLTEIDSIEASPTLEQNMPSPTDPLPSATLTSTRANFTSPYVSPDHTPVAPSQPSSVPQGRPHHSIIPPFVGSAIGATSLLLAMILAVCVCRCVRARRSQNKNIGSGRWFISDEKDDFVVSIRVPPPTVPLKGILLPSPTPTSQSPGDLHPDRVSLTSSQFSVLINNLPKARYSGLEHGPTPPVRQNSPIRATRIGPSPSDFLANLFGQSRSFTSSNSASSQATSAQSPPRHVELPPRYHPGGTSLSVDVHTPTFPPATASPHLKASSGPRGHGLVRTGDQGGLAPSFAQWRYQRSLARDRLGDSSDLVPS